MKNNWIKRGIPAALAVVFVAGTLSGCQRKGQTVPDRATETPVAMGRYVETEVSLPEEIQDSLVYGLLKGKDGTLELYAGAKDAEGYVNDILRYEYDGETWRKDDIWAGGDVVRDLHIQPRSITYGMDGHYYMGGMDADYVHHLYQIRDDGTYVEMMPDVFGPEEGESYGMIPTKCEVTGDGRILLYDYREVYLYTADGKKVFTMPKDFSGSDMDSRGFATDDELVTVLDGNLVRYSLEDGQVKETIPYESLAAGDSSSMELFGDGKGGIYVAGETGLSHISGEGTIWETLMDGSLNTLGMRSVSLLDFVRGSEEDFYGIYLGQMSSSVQMYHYTYDPEMASIPPVTLNVYAMEDNSTVRQAAALFQKDHPDVKVEFRAALQGEGDITEDIIRSLNTELLSGKGADVLILDSLPAEAYKEKGVLMDMRDVFAGIQKESPLAEHIVEGFTGEDGAVHEMPAKIQIPVIFAPEGLRNAYASLDAMKDYNGDRPLVGTDTYSNLLRLVANIQYQELFADESGSISQETLVKYLETVKALGDDNGSRNQFTKEEMESLRTNNEVVPRGIRGSSIEYDTGKVAAGLEYLQSVSGIMIPMEVMDKRPELNMGPVNGIYFPSTIVGINQATKQAETAKEFVKYIFSTPVQSVDFYDGFPVNKAAREIMKNTENGNYSMVASMGDGYSIVALWPTDERREQLFQLIDGLNVPVTIDEIVMGMIISESKDYFEGKATAGQAAAAVSQKLKLYLAEQAG